MNKQQLDELERLAQAATPGPWDIGAYEGGWRSIISASGIPFIGSVVAKVAAGLDTARYIAAMHPQTTLALIAEIRRLREALHEALNVQTKRELALYREVQQLKKELEQKP